MGLDCCSKYILNEVVSLYVGSLRLGYDYPILISLTIPAIMLIFTDRSGVYCRSEIRRSAADVLATEYCL